MSFGKSSIPSATLRHLNLKTNKRAQPHSDEPNLEFWFARDLQEPLGYARWENFLTAIQRAIESCKTTGYEVGHHFRGVTKMVPLGSGAERPIEDFILTRYAKLSRYSHRHE